MLRNKNLKKIAKEIKKLVVKTAHQSKTSHIGPALSISDILAVLYFRIMKLDPKRPEWPERDRFILSKGHAAVALYAVLALRGFFPLSYLKSYCADGGMLHGHPCKEAAPGIEVSSGSLGHGLSIAAGMALAAKHDGRKNQIYVLVGDGECNEGSLWEAVRFIGVNRLPNVVVIVDWNKFQGFEVDNGFDLDDFGQQWRAFGWKVLNVPGHDVLELESKIKMAQKNNIPTVLIADTVSGKGLMVAENTLSAHYYLIPDKKTYRRIISNINEE